MQEAENFKKYSEAFEKKLELIVIDEISAELYCKKYLVHTLPGLLWRSTTTNVPKTVTKSIPTCT